MTIAAIRTRLIQQIERRAFLTRLAELQNDMPRYALHTEAKQTLEAELLWIDTELLEAQQNVDVLIWPFPYEDKR